MSDGNLHHAKLADEQVTQAKPLEGAFLPSGRVMVVGGWHYPDKFCCVETYDPVTDILSGVRRLDIGRGNSHTATLLTDG